MHACAPACARAAPARALNAHLPCARAGPEGGPGSGPAAGVLRAAPDHGRAGGGATCACAPAPAACQQLPSLPAAALPASGFNVCRAAGPRPQAKLEALEREVLEVNANNDRLQRSHAELTELQVRARAPSGSRRTAQPPVASAPEHLGTWPRILLRAPPRLAHLAPAPPPPPSAAGRAPAPMRRAPCPHPPPPRPGRCCWSAPVTSLTPRAARPASGPAPPCARRPRRTTARRCCRTGRRRCVRRAPFMWLTQRVCCMLHCIQRAAAHRRMGARRSARTCCGASRGQPRPSICMHAPHAAPARTRAR